VLESFRCIQAVAEEAEHIPLAVVVAPSSRIFEDVFVNWEVCKADTRCVCWVLDTTTDADVIFSTVRFAADMIWYPEIASAISPHILAELFFDCLLDGRVIPSKAEHASTIGMALASVLSTNLSIEPDNKALRELCDRIYKHIKWGSRSEPKFFLALTILRFVAGVHNHADRNVHGPRPFRQHTRSFIHCE